MGSVILIKEFEEPGSSVSAPRRTTAMFELLGKLGVEVVWICQHDNQPILKVGKAKYLPLPVKVYGIASGFSIRRLFSQIIFSVLATCVILIKAKSDTKVVSSYPSISCAVFLSLVRRLKKFHLTIDVRDLTHETYHLHLPKAFQQTLPLRRMVDCSLKQLFLFCMRSADSLITISPVFLRDELIRSDSKPITAIPLQPFSPVLSVRPQNSIRRKIFVLYYGVVSSKLSWDTVSRLSKAIGEKGGTFLVVGRGNREMCMDGVDYYPEMSLPLLESLRDSYVFGFCVHANRPDFNTSLPTKFFWYLNYGIPVIVEKSTFAGLVTGKYGVGCSVEEFLDLIECNTNFELRYTNFVDNVVALSSGRIVLENDLNWVSNNIITHFNRCSQGV